MYLLCILYASTVKTDAMLVATERSLPLNYLICFEYVFACIFPTTRALRYFWQPFSKSSASRDKRCIKYIFEYFKIFSCRLFSLITPTCVARHYYNGLYGTARQFLRLM